MSGTSYAVKKVWTEAELQALPEDGYLHEVVSGELIRSPKNDFFTGGFALGCLSRWKHSTERIVWGAVLDSSTGFGWTITIVAPPMFPSSPKPGWTVLVLNRPPEILSRRPGFGGGNPLTEQHAEEINERLKDFFASGTPDCLDR